MEEVLSVTKPLRPWLLRIALPAALAIAASSGTIFAQQRAAAPPPAHVDPQSRQMLDQIIRVLGGPAFLNAKSLSTQGRAFFFQDGNTAGMEPFSSAVVYPDKRRFTYGKNKKMLSMDTGNISYGGETKAVTLINNGEKGWELDQYGLIDQPDKQVQAWILSNRYSLENLLRLRINEPGVLIQMGKVDFVDNVPTQGIEITEPGGISVRLDVDPHTYLPARITYRIRNPKINDWDEYSDAYSDYKVIDGVTLPMHVTRYLNGDRIGETFRNSAKFNQDYPPNYFTAE
jgi:hypothetical protein